MTGLYLHQTAHSNAFCVMLERKHGFLFNLLVVVFCWLHGWGRRQTRERSARLRYRMWTGQQCRMSVRISFSGGTQMAWEDHTHAYVHVQGPGEPGEAGWGLLSMLLCQLFREFEVTST